MNEEIEAVKKNTEKIKEMDAQIKLILDNTLLLRSGLNESYSRCLPMFGRDYAAFTNEEKHRLGSLVNQTKALSALFGKTIA